MHRWADIVDADEDKRVEVRKNAIEKLVRLVETVVVSDDGEITDLVIKDIKALLKQ
jgi:hypothetical protein